jgi:ABC-type multidrug transport system ATPase subunit
MVEFRNVTARAADGTMLLDDVSFAVGRGAMVAVVGPTGAGKTSLARALTGAIPVEDGTVRVAGHVAFVPQDDALHADLSLRRAVEYAAALRLPDATAAARQVRVTTVLEELGLTAHAGTKIGDLSGGQRKRASIAAQLLAEPDVLVLDEPTAGLDPGYEKIVLSTLRAIADSGRTVIVVTHSVDALKASDRVLFLAAGGSTAFYGPPKQAASYFKLTDTADVFLALDAAAPRVWQQRFRAHRLHKRYVTDESGDETPPAAPVNAASGAGQIRMLLRRHADVLRGDRRHLTLLALQAPVIGALLWAVLPAHGLAPEKDGDFSSKAGIVILFIVLSTTWLGITNAIREVVKERAIFRWEASAGLSPRAYIASKAAWLGGLTVVQSTIVAFLATGRQHAPGGGALFGSARLEIIAAAVLAGVAASALGLALSAASASPDRAMATLPTTLVLQLVLAGEWAASAHVPLLHQARVFVGSRWAMEAMAASLRGNIHQLLNAVGVLAALTTALLVCATAFAQRLARPAATSTARPALPRISFGQLAGVAGAAAALLTAGAGATGVLGMTSASAPPSTTATHFAAPKAPKPHAPVVVATPTPTTAPAAPIPVVAAPNTVTIATTPVVRSTKSTVVDTEPVPQQTSVSIPVVPDPVVPAPTPTTIPTPTATSTTTPSPWGAFSKLFQPFSPQVNR